MIDRKFGDGFAAEKAIPGDEPVFIIRAQDKASVSAILAYARCAWDAGATGEFLDDIIKTVRWFEEWQRDNAESVSTPD